MEMRKNRITKTGRKVSEFLICMYVFVWYKPVSSYRVCQGPGQLACLADWPMFSDKNFELKNICFIIKSCCHILFSTVHFYFIILPWMYQPMQLLHKQVVATYLLDEAQKFCSSISSQANVNEGHNPWHTLSYLFSTNLNLGKSVIALKNIPPGE